MAGIDDACERAAVKLAAMAKGGRMEHCEWGGCTSTEVVADVVWEAPPAEPHTLGVCAEHAEHLEHTGTHGRIEWRRARPAVRSAT
jgi:hypothetical protein